MERDLGNFQGAVGERKQAAVADGNAVNVGSQVLEGGLPIAYRFAMHDPLLTPDFRGNASIKGCFLEESALEGCAKQHGKGLDRQKEAFSSGAPGGTNCIQSAARNQVVDMRMIKQVARPGMQHTDQANLPTHQAWIFGQALSSLSRCLEE